MKKTVFPAVRDLTTAAMLTAMSVVIGIVCKTFLNFGGGLFRVTFENLPILLTGILYGPVAGALVGGASDWISYLLSAQTYPPNLLVTAGAVAVGAVSGMVSVLLQKRGKRYTAGGIMLSAGAAHAVGSMIIKPIGLFSFYGWAVLVRIPLYLVIAPLEIALLCCLFRRKAFCRVFQILPIGSEEKKRSV